MQNSKGYTAKQVVNSIFLLLVFFSLFSCGEKNSDDVSKIQMLLKRTTEENNLPSLSIAIGYKDSIRFAEAIGYADMENKVSATPKTVYRVGSISKSLTATVIMKLRESKRIDIDSNIRKYCPSFPDKGTMITSRQLLAHLGGIRHYDFDNIEKEYYSIKRYGSSLEALNIFKNDSLVVRPGVKHHYSSYGYSILGCAIENLAKSSFEHAITKNIFQPANMGDSYLDYPERLIPNRARLYETVENGAWSNSRFVDLSNKFPGGGILSTPTDLVKFANTLLSGNILNRDSLKEMWEEQLTKDGQKTQYTLGWRVSEDYTEFYHGGSSAGGTAYLYVVPEKELVVAFATNTGSGQWSSSRHEFVQQIAELFFRGTVDFP